MIKAVWRLMSVTSLAFSMWLLGSVAWASAQQGAGGPPPEVRAFVRQTFIHGVPYEEANKYDSSAVPALLSMLADRKDEAHWPNVVATLGIIGDEKAVGPLIEFLETGEGKLSHSEYIAKSSVPMALGYLINKGRSGRALAYLEESLDAAVWARRKIAWVSPYHAVGRDRDVQLSIMAIWGLALSGQPSAREALVALQKPAATRAGREFQAAVSDVVTLALRDHEIIAREGLLEYYRRARIPEAAEPPGLITGSEKPPAIMTGGPPPPVAQPAMQEPQLPPRPALAAPPPIPKPSLPTPPQRD